MGGAVFLLPFVMGGMGGGDVKLFAALGAWLGWSGILITALLSAVAGGMVALAALIRNNGEWNGFTRVFVALRMWDWEGLRSSKRIPYTVPTAIGLAAFFILRGSL